MTSHCIDQIIDIMNKKTINDAILERIESNILIIENNLKKYIDMGINQNQDDTNQLKNKLLFIEQQFYLKKNYETEIDNKIGRFEQKIDILKHILISLNKDVKYIKEQILLNNNNKIKKSKRWKIWEKIFKNKYIIK